ncbi:MAG: DEAD/DEAH box helicase, partial [Deltaproteobacteria bacterium]|nr:DEAD/DEAH box helicase [Deltaproteobacteria bacterium]
AQVLPLSLMGKDIAGQAQTGTGKTAAFLVTLFVRLLARKDKKAGMSGALIIAPTRELAQQIYEEAEKIGRHTGLTMGLAIGGLDYREQADAIRQGLDIIICTPGRIIDYLKQGIYKTQKVEVVVVDEADRLMDLGFINDLRYILRKLPPFTQRQSMLFSATLSYRILETTYEFMNVPEFISATPPNELAVERIEQALFHVSREEKLPLLLGLLGREEWSSVLIFVNTKAGVEWLSKKLKGNQLPAEGITGDLPQRQRLKLMQRFKDGQLKILVATDVASRGIHVEDISHVINYDLPQDVENYVHRIGRTARAGKSGKAVSFACEDYVFHLEPLETLLGYKIPVVWPDETWFKADQAGEVHGRYRERPERPRYQKDRGPEARRQPGARKRPEEKAPRGPLAPWKKAPASTRPGGIFGLSPKSWPQTRVETNNVTSPPEPVEENLPPEKVVTLAAVVTAEIPEAVASEVDAGIETAEASPELKKKKKRRRRKRKAKSSDEANGNLPGDDFNGELEEGTSTDSDLDEEVPF